MNRKEVILQNQCRLQHNNQYLIHIFTTFKVALRVKNNMFFFIDGKILVGKEQVEKTKTYMYSLESKRSTRKLNVTGKACVAKEAMTFQEISTSE